uniref:Uncharacterized protein n=1 Tax=Anopheles albimanus TaxID=7167 RepID=A0A182FZ70_ANOAL
MTHILFSRMSDHSTVTEEENLSTLSTNYSINKIQNRFHIRIRNHGSTLQLDPFTSKNMEYLNSQVRKG